MKTILFFYYDCLFKRSVVDAYNVHDSKVDDTIDWRRQCLNRHIQEGQYINLRIEVVDKFDFTMLLS